MNSKYIKIIDDLSLELFGPDKLIKAESNNNNTSICIYALDKLCYTIFTNNGNFLLYDWGCNNERKEIPIDSLDIFNGYAKMILIDFCKPSLIMDYKKKILKKLPENLGIKNTVDLSRINKKWIKKTFEEITSSILNSESIENIEFKKSIDSLCIEFDINGGRWGIHKDNEIIINDRGNISVNLCDFIEGRGIETELKERINKLIYND